MSIALGHFTELLAGQGPATGQGHRDQMGEPLPRLPSSCPTPPAPRSVGSRAGVCTPSPLGPHANTCNVVGTGDQRPGAQEWVSGRQTGSGSQACDSLPGRALQAQAGQVSQTPVPWGGSQPTGPAGMPGGAVPGKGGAFLLAAEWVLPNQPCFGEKRRERLWSQTENYCLLRALWPRLKPARTATRIKPSLLEEVAGPRTTQPRDREAGRGAPLRLPGWARGPEKAHHPGW